MSLIAAMEESVAEVTGQSQPTPTDRGGRGVVTVETFVVVDETSSEESEEDASDKGRFQRDDDDEDEIEYGEGFQGHRRPSTSIRSSGIMKARRSDQQPGPPGTSVSSFSTSTAAPPPRAPHTPDVQPPPDDTFGITYRPMRAGQQQSQPGGSLPSGPAFEDEAEFEEDLLGSDLFATRRVKEEDDDFGGDFAPAVQVTEVLRQAREQYSNAPTTSGAITGGDPPLSPPLPPLPPDGEAEGLASEPLEGSLDLMAAAAQAFNELANIYGQGFGDQEVRTLELGESAADEPTTNVKVGGSLSAFTIAEEDEEEELAAESKEAQQQAAQDRAMGELRRQWEGLNAPPPSAKDSGRASMDGAGMLYDIKYDEALRQFHEQHASSPASSSSSRDTTTTTVIASTGLRSLFGPTKLSYPKAQEDLSLLRALTREHFDPADPIHLRLIRRIYKFLTGGQNCSTVGAHWEAVGFQGADPRTDLNRSMGVFSLLQALSFTETAPALVRTLFQKSQHEVYHWPFLLVSIGFTSQAVQVIESGALNKEGNRLASIMEVAHLMHQAIFYHYLQQLVGQPSVHHAVHLSAVRDYVEKKPLQVLNTYVSHLASGQALRTGREEGDDDERVVGAFISIETAAEIVGSDVVAPGAFHGKKRYLT